MDVCIQCGESIPQDAWSLTDVVLIAKGVHEVRHFCSVACYGAWENRADGRRGALTASVDYRG